MLWWPVGQSWTESYSVAESRECDQDEGPSVLVQKGRADCGEPLCGLSLGGESVHEASKAPNGCWVGG